MGILDLTKQRARDAENEFFRVLILITLCAFFSLGVFSCAETKNTTQKSSAEQKSTAETNLETKPPKANAPPRRVTQIDDARIKQLLKADGKPLLVNFWATWCAPCREEFPDLVKIDGEYRGKIDFITVSLDFVEEIDTGVPDFLTKMEAEMPTYLLTSADENALISSIAKEWNGALPFTILYNEKGEIIYTHQGKASHETLKNEIEKTLAGKQ